MNLPASYVYGEPRFCVMINCSIAHKRGNEDASFTYYGPDGVV
jgi:hypothetical protein